MGRPEERISPMLELLEKAWRKNPDQRLGQLIGNATRKPDPHGFLGDYRDPFNVEDHETWLGLEKMAEAGEPPIEGDSV